MLGAERFNDCLVSVAPEPLNDNLQDNVAQHKVIATKQLPPLNTLSYMSHLHLFLHSCLRLYLLYVHLSSALLFQIRAKKLGEGSKPSSLAWRRQTQRQKRNIASPPVPAKNEHTLIHEIFLGGGFVQLEKCLLTWQWIQH